MNYLIFKAGQSFQIQSDLSKDQLKDQYHGFGVMVLPSVTVIGGRFVE